MNINMKKMLFNIMSLLIVLVIALTAGCGQEKKSSENGPADGKLKIITSFYPMYITALNVADGVDGVEIVNMTQPQTGCLHDYQLTTEDMKLLATGNVMIVNGGGMESFLDKVTKSQSKLKIIDASEGIPMLKDDEHGEENPHVWVSVANAILQVDNVVKGLSEADPAHKERYEANGKVYKEKLQKLQADMHQRLDKYQGRQIITFHEAFPYFAQEFNLKLAGIIEREPGSEPTPEELEETIKLIQSLGIKVIFTEPQYSSKAAQTIANATGAQISTLDPVVTGDATPDAKDAYIKVMEQNAQALEAAFQ